MPVKGGGGFSPVWQFQMRWDFSALKDDGDAVLQGNLILVDLTIEGEYLEPHTTTRIEGFGKAGVGRFIRGEESRISPLADEYEPRLVSLPDCLG